MAEITPGHQYAQRAAMRAIAAGEPTGWFERVYAAAESGETDVPWFSEGPCPELAEWAKRRGLSGTGRKALVVGCGLGDDAEYAAQLGYDTVGFDVAPTAIATARRRFPDSRVDYRVADLLALPDEWRQAFHLVIEVWTVQALPEPVRHDAIAAIADTVAPGGTLIVVAGSRDVPIDQVDGPPWPLSRDEVESFADHGLETVSIEELPPSGPGVGTWRAEFRRPGAHPGAEGSSS